MQYLPYLTSVDTEITIEKLDKVAKTLSDKIKAFAKFFGIFLSWCIFNVIVSLFIDRTRSLSLDAYRMVAEGIRNLSTQDITFLFALIFDDKICCLISLAVICAFELALFVLILDSCDRRAAHDGVSNRSNFTQSRRQNDVYVVSYKQQVAFLA